MSFVDHDFSSVAVRAESYLERGDPTGAINLLRQYLSRAPDHAAAHAFLAHALVDAHRLHAAELEAQTALTAEPELVMAHVAMARVLVVRRRWKDAEAQLTVALELDPSSVSALSTLAGLHAQAGRIERAIEVAQRARDLEPDDPELLAQLADLELDAGHLEAADRLARASLDARPNPAAIRVLGYLALRRGDTASARDHAGWILHDYPMHAPALGLLAAVKARESWFLGLWWRWTTWMQAMGDTRTILVLVGAFAVYRSATILMEGTANAPLLPIVNLFWYAAVIYTWVSPGLFSRMLDRELEKVRLGPEF